MDIFIFINFKIYIYKKYIIYFVFRKKYLDIYYEIGWIYYIFIVFIIIILIILGNFFFCIILENIYYKLYIIFF